MNIFALIAALFSAYVIYMLWYEIIALVMAPIGQSWMIYLLIGLFLIDFMVIAINIFRNLAERISSKKAEADGKDARKAKKEKKSKLQKKAEFEKKPEKWGWKKKEAKKIRIPWMFLAKLTIAFAVMGMGYYFSNRITMILGGILLIIFLIGSIIRGRQPKAETAGGISESSIRLEKPASKKELDTLNKKEVEQIQKASGFHLAKLKEQEKALLQREIKEEAELKALTERMKQEELAIIEKERMKKKAEMMRGREEAKLKEQENAELKRLQVIEKRLKAAQERKEKIKQQEDMLIKRDRAVYRGQKLRPKSLYETDFDLLIEMIDKYDSMKITEIADIFGIPNETAEQWAQLLEENNIAKIHYPAIGSPELKKWKKT